MPLRAWWEQRVWQQRWAALFLIAALTPFLLLHLGGDPGNFQWSRGGPLAGLRVHLVHRPVRADPPRAATLAAARESCFVTAVAGVAIAISLEKHLAAGDPNVVRLILGVGLPEELAKALPVYLFVFRSPQPRTLRSFLCVGAVSGLAFGAAEAVSY